VKMVKSWNWFSREGVDSPSADVSKMHLDKVLSNLLELVLPQLGV